MSEFKLVIFDYAKKQIENASAQKALSDLILVKQKNFERTDPDYVVLDKHDMVGTHFMIYETSNLFSPRLIAALRVTYEDRALMHKLKTPLQELMPHLDEKCQRAYQAFRKKHATIADCNSWFVDPNFSLKNSGLRLSDVGYAMVYLQVMRMGFDHIAGCTNEKYKASRWLENIGSFEKGYMFTHPVVPDPHMMILVDSFNEPYLKSVYLDHKEIFDRISEIVPEKMNYIGIQEAVKKYFMDFGAGQGSQERSTAA